MSGEMHSSLVYTIANGMGMDIKKAFIRKYYKMLWGSAS